MPSSHVRSRLALQVAPSLRLARRLNLIFFLAGWVFTLLMKESDYRYMLGYILFVCSAHPITDPGVSSLVRTPLPADNCPRINRHRHCSLQPRLQ
jgi:hypothetical protein